MSLKEIKLKAISATAGGAGGEEPEEENMAAMTKAVMQAAQKKVVSQVSGSDHITYTNCGNKVNILCLNVCISVITIFSGV